MFSLQKRAPPKVLNFPKQHLYVLAPYTSFSFPGAWFNQQQRKNHQKYIIFFPPSLLTSPHPGRHEKKKNQPNKQTNKQTNTFPNFYLAKRCMKCFVAHSQIHNYHIAWVVLMVPLQYMALDLMPCVPQGLNLGGETGGKSSTFPGEFCGLAKVRDLFFWVGEW